MNNHRRRTAKARRRMLRMLREHAQLNRWQAARLIRHNDETKKHDLVHGVLRRRDVCFRVEHCMSMNSEQQAAIVEAAWRLADHIDQEVLRTLSNQLTER